MRKLIRPSLSKPGSGDARRGGKRTLPPEATHAEAAYLQQAVNDGSALVVTLLDGRELRGRLEYYDRDCLKLEPEGGARVLLRKDKIKYYRAEQTEGATEEKVPADEAAAAAPESPPPAAPKKKSSGAGSGSRAAARRKRGG